MFTKLFLHEIPLWMSSYPLRPFTSYYLIRSHVKVHFRTWVGLGVLETSHLMRPLKCDGTPFSWSEGMRTWNSNRWPMVPLLYFGVREDQELVEPLHPEWRVSIRKPLLQDTLDNPRFVTFDLLHVWFVLFPRSDRHVVVVGVLCQK